MTELKGTLKQYFSFLRDEKNLTESTILSYQRDINGFSRFYGKNIKSAKEDDILNYINNMKNHGCSSSTLSRNMVSLRSIYSFLEENNLIKTNPIKNIHMPKIKKQLPQILTSSEISLLLEMPQGDDFKAVRDRAMLETLYASGLKVSELLSLNVSNVNLRRSMINCNISSKARIVPIGKACVKALQDYLKNVRSSVASSDEPSLFLNCNGTRMTRQGFWKIIKYYKDKAGIEKDITPHTLRHSFAAHLLENGADIDIIGEMMGLSDPASTAVYKKIIENKMFDIYKKAHPRA